jgi:DNA-3-methyladenine glycosylase II
MPQSLHASASRELADRDRVLAELHREHGPMRLPRRPEVPRRFEALARTITHQQLAGRAAQAIWARVRATVPGPFDATAVLGLADGTLRAAGLSASKEAAVLDLARLVAAGSVRLDRAGRLSDGEVVAMLTQAKGVGPWTAHMFLLFDLHRLDVWPTGDYGVRVGFARAWDLTGVPSPGQLAELGEPFRPYRSVVAWYCWRAVDTALRE